MIARGLAPTLLLASLLPMQRASAEGGPPVGIAPLPADLEAMRQSLRALEAAVDSRDPGLAEALLSPALDDEARLAVRETLSARIRTLPPGARYSLRSDIGPGAVVPVGPEQVQVQVTGTVASGGRSAEPGAVYVELDAVEGSGRRQWLLRSVRFAGVRAGPSPASRVGLVAAGAAVGGAVVGGLLLLVRRRARLREALRR